MNQSSETRSTKGRADGSQSDPSGASGTPSFYDLLLRTYTANFQALRLPDPEHLDGQALFAVTEHCVRFIDLTSAFLTKQIGSEVSLSVKFLWEMAEGEDPALHTVFRSTNTRAMREAYAPINNFSYAKNTAFKALLDGWPSITSFASDNLLEDIVHRRYENANSNWVIFYTATAVVTIPSAPGADIFPIGFVCADAKKEGLDTPEIRLTLESAASHLYNVLGVLFAGKRSDQTSRARAKTKQTMAVIPCGWNADAHGLRPIDHENQLAFQKTIEKIEFVYATDPAFTGEAPRPLSGIRRVHGASPLFEETLMIDDDDLAQLARESDSPDAKRYLAVRASPKLTEEQFAKVMKDLQERNPEAAQMLSRRAG